MSQHRLLTKGVGAAGASESLTDPLVRIAGFERLREPHIALLTAFVEEVHIGSGRACRQYGA